MGSDQHIFQHTHVAEDAAVLEGACDSAFDKLVDAQPGEWCSVQENGAGGRLVQACDQVKEGSFAGAVGADHADSFTGVQVKTDVVDCQHTAEIA